MSRRQPIPGDGHKVAQRQVVLVIGRPGKAAAHVLGTPDISVVVIRLAALDHVLLSRVAPDVAAFPLMAPEADATQILERLDTLGFTGEAMVFVPVLPDRAMVQHELQSLAPRLTLTLVEPGE
jgi:hypothetical protein